MYRLALLVLLLLFVTGGCALARSDLHVLTFNVTGDNRDLAIRIDGNLVFWGSAASVQNREPHISFDLPLMVSKGSHTIVVQSAKQIREATFSGTRFVTIEVRLKSHEIEIKVFQKRMLYL
jgi:hypothetical protein